MTFSLSQKSLANLAGVKPSLVSVVKRAIEITTVDFIVMEGLRTVERQKMLVATLKSQTMASKHITGDAVDLVPLIAGQPIWNITLCDNVADAMKAAAKELNVSIRWGAAWNIDNIATWPKTMEDAMNHYVDFRRSKGQRPFIDGPHFELS